MKCAVEELPELTFLPPARSEKAFSGLRTIAAASCALLIFVLLVQWATGATKVEFGSIPDEASHYVTARMIAEYLKNPTSPPLEFAKDYYVHYPKVAFGIWPPVYHVALGVWIAVVSPSRESAILFAGLITWLVGLVVMLTIRRVHGPGSGFATALVFISLPFVQRASGGIYLDLMVALFCYLAAVSFGRYLDSCRWQDSAWFGLLASAAILTKYNALCLALLPVMAVVSTRRYDVIRRWSFWLPAVITVAICGPWYLSFYSLVKYASEPFPSNSDLWPSLFGNAAALIAMVGIPLLAIAVAGVMTSTSGAWAKMQGIRTALICLAISVLSFHSFLYPIVDSRYLLTAAAALATFVPTGMRWLVTRFPQRWTAAVVASLLVCHVLAVDGLSIPRKPDLGFRRVTEQLARQAGTDIVLISSNAVGEGSFVAETAMRESPPRTYVLRASKILAHAHWSGLEYKKLYGDLEQLLQILDTAGVGAIVADASATNDFPHGEDLIRALDGAQRCWSRTSHSDVGRSPYVYHRLPACDVTDATIAIDMTRTLGNVLTRTRRLASLNPLPDR